MPSALHAAPGASRPLAVVALELVAAGLAGLVVGTAGSFVQASAPRGMPVGVIAALLSTLAVVIGAGLATASRAGAAAAFALWILAVLALSLRRPEGDLVLAARPTAFVWLYGGSIAGGACLVPDYRRLRWARSAARVVSKG